ncbi:lytic transglycosylase domain-containing protein [Sinanaerobacter sp. ZZT-01]|uniref:lytic transglycosylase domain-containing protein n=1 Tax=Sinanaerobacter sp. ZZT-01 TaxID=3111540 RepID=UPI002D7A119B|nr:transglycosylase SLT domain-containing protein [Sinanaerobacter sp. ZZT-01]WRR94577.1 transglycosylase SLT domain-containing protein [Sinanaerobacter sp. ZZT-01]
MAKKLISVWLSLTILLFSSISIYAGDNVRGDFFIKDISINGQQIINYQMDDPFFLYKNTTYLPLNAEMGKILGLKIELDMESRTLKLWKAESTQTQLSQRWMKNNKQDVKTEIANNVSVIAYETANNEKAAEKADDTESETGSDDELQSDQETVIELPKLEAKQVDLKGLPVLVKGTVPYIPVAAITSNGLFGWDVYFDSYTGIYISTKEGIKAKSLFNEPRSRYNRGLVSYIKKYNSSYTTDKAQNLVFLFQHEANIYGVDQTLLLAVAHRESTFNPSAKSSSGSLGMMQIMPSTAARYGISSTQLLDPHVNIEFGAKYLKERIDAYGGNVTKALSAYNQGSVAVNRGSYSTRYAAKIISTQSNLKTYLSSGGYGTGK